VHLGKVEVRFTEGKDTARINDTSVDLGSSILVENSRVLVPLNASFSLLSGILHKNVDFHPAGRRVFVDNAGIHFTSELKKAEKSSLVLSFSQPVNPSIFQEGNKSRLVFKREPLISDLANQPFDDKAIRSLSFSEENGMAALTITGDTSLNVSVGSDGKTIVVQALPSLAPAATEANKAAPAQATPDASATPQPPQPSGTPSQNQGHGFAVYFVMIDPSHGGSDRGAFLADKIDEKDLTLAVARKLRAELQDRGIAARLLRDADVDLSLEQRAELTNAQHAGMYVAIHAGAPGEEVRVYTPALASSSVFSSGEQTHAKPGRFLPWETAQAAFLNQSQTVASAVIGELQKRDVRNLSLTVPMRPLNNIVAPAIAVELSADRSSIQDLLSTRIQSQVAASVASGIARARAQIEAAK
jgi:N-acetylmuramoyl-L-alanine amidase